MNMNILTLVLTQLVAIIGLSATKAKGSNLLPIVQPDITSCNEVPNPCEDNPAYIFDYELSDGKLVPRKCAWLSEDPVLEESRKDKWCQRIVNDDGSMVQDKCPHTCDKPSCTQCADDSSFTFGIYDQDGVDVIRNCAWIIEISCRTESRRNNWCNVNYDGGDIVNTRCPFACGICDMPSATPSTSPSVSPTFDLAVDPPESPTPSPTAGVTTKPTAEPTARPTAGLTTMPTAKPTATPTARPTLRTTVRTTVSPTVGSTVSPSSNPGKGKGKGKGSKVSKSSKSKGKGGKASKGKGKGGKSSKSKGKGKGGKSSKGKGKGGKGSKGKGKGDKGGKSNKGKGGKASKDQGKGKGGKGKGKNINHDTNNQMKMDAERNEE